MFRESVKQEKNRKKPSIGLNIEVTFESEPEDDRTRIGELYRSWLRIHTDSVPFAKVPMTYVNQ